MTQRISSAQFDHRLKVCRVLSSGPLPRFLMPDPNIPFLVDIDRLVQVDFRTSPVEMISLGEITSFDWLTI